MDIAELMQEAYGQEDVYPEAAEMISFIISVVGLLTHEEMVEVAKYLAKIEPKGAPYLVDIAAGLAVDLSKLPRNVLEVVYDMFKMYKKNAGDAESILVE